MKIKLLLPILFLLSILQAQDTIYYDVDWNKTNKERQVYYRPMPLKKVGELTLLVDYYKNGTMQFQGYIYPNDEHKYVGDAYWYDENGFDDGTKQSINESSQKELTYYNQDGSVWKKIEYGENGKKSKIKVYLKGKELFSGSIPDYDKYVGSFSPEIPDYFYDRPFQETKEMEAIESVPMIAPPASGTKKTEKPKEIYFEVIYWENGQKAKESKFELGEYGNGKLVEEKFWDETGKLISEMNFENFSKEKKYLKIVYFTRNNFAVGAEYIWEMKNESHEGKSSFYDAKGKLIREETYRQGLILEDVIYSDSNEKSTRIYQKGEPFEGDFTDEAGPFTFSFTLKSGQKTGKETVRREDRKERVAEGIYQNGVRFEGKFISTEQYIVSQYKNGILEGIQTIYQNFYDDIPAEEFEMKNGKREGFRKQYENGELKYESLYKNDTIFSGKIREYDEELIYENGNLIERLQFTGDYEGLEVVEKYVNNQLDQIIYFNFTIAENPQESYKGKYKNGKPFQGYFANQVMVDDIHLIDYYENGERKYQYSFEFLEQMDNYRHYIYNQKAEFENGKILNGAEFFPPTDIGFLKVNYKDGKVKGLQVNVFAMHYFNRIDFERKADEILMSEFQSPYTVRIFPQENMITASFYENGKLIRTQKGIEEVPEKSPNSRTIYYQKDNLVKTFSISIEPDQFEGMDLHSLSFKIFSMFPVADQSLDDVFEKITSVFKSEDLHYFEEINQEAFFPFPKEDYLSFMEYDENGKPKFGIRILQEENGKYLLESIEDDKVKKIVKVNSISELTANDHKIFEDLLHQLLND